MYTQNYRILENCLIRLQREVKTREKGRIARIKTIVSEAYEALRSIEEVNGYPNNATYKLSLHIDNDPYLYDCSREITRMCEFDGEYDAWHVERELKSWIETNLLDQVETPHHERKEKPKTQLLYEGIAVEAVLTFHRDVDFLFLANRYIEEIEEAKKLEK